MTARPEGAIRECTAWERCLSLTHGKICLRDCEGDGRRYICGCGATPHVMRATSQRPEAAGQVLRLYRHGPPWHEGARGQHGQVPIEEPGEDGDGDGGD